MSRLCWLLLAGASLHAETVTLTLKQAMDRALRENPELVMARLDEVKAQQGVRLAKDPFYPRVGVGSGLAYTSGFPQSIEGSAPSIFQARASAYAFNRQQSYLLAQSRENARAAQFATASRRDEIAFRTASFYLDADRAARLAGMAQKQAEAFAKVEETIRARENEGRALPIETRRASVDTLKAKQRYESYQADRDFAEHSLALILGYAPGDSVQASSADRAAPPRTGTEQEAIDRAMAANKELRRIESALLAKGFEAKAARAQRLPRVDFFAEYALFSRYNHLDEYFRKFQRNNTQVGASFQVPFLTGPGVHAQIAQADADSARLKAEMNATRGRIAMDIHASYLNLQKAETARQVAQADLDLAREQLSVVLAQMQEGRAALRQVEEARVLENEKWIAFYDAQFSSEKAGYELLRNTGELAAALQ